MESTPDPRTLVLVRHAKSSWEDDVEDHERPLSARGRRDATALGGLLAERAPHIDLVLCSTATRTRQTWQGATGGGAAADEVRDEDAIYGAWVPELVDLVRAVPDDVHTLLVLGHAPGIPDLVDHLCVRDNASAWDRVDDKYPTSGVAVVEVPGPWRDLGKGRARLADFVVPRG